MTRVKLDTIAFDAGTQIRAAIDQHVVADYADAMTNGATFPPIVLFHDGNQHYLADGFHRFMAAQRNQWRDIDADVRPGTKEDALWFALGANRAHATNGLRLSHADKRQAAKIAVLAWPNRSAGSIAEQLGVHQTFVSDIKRQHDLKSALPDEVVGRDGKRYPAAGSARVDVQRISQAEASLRDGKGVSEVAAALRMSTRTVQKIRERAGIPLGLDKTREGIQRRRDQMREMAAAGYSSRQSEEALRRGGRRGHLQQRRRRTQQEPPAGMVERSAVGQMPSLFDKHNPAPCDPLPRDPHVTEPVEIRRLSKQCRQILARLQQGPATRRELTDIALNVTARISDLRAAGYHVECVEPHATGRSIYQLFSAEGASR